VRPHRGFARIGEKGLNIRMARARGVFIVLEGPDKCGKSTQARLLVSALKKTGREVVHTREPGGTRLAERIRGLLLDPGPSVHPLAELLLYEAGRAQHVSEFIRPALARGAAVVSERFTLATLAYQGCARGFPLGLIRRLNRIATGGLEPDLTVVLDIPDSAFRQRDPSRKLDRLEREDTAFRRRMRAGYRKLSVPAPATGRPRGRILRIDSTPPRAAVHRRILALLGTVLRMPLKLIKSPA